jgi:type II secretory pathway component PulJ
VKNEKPSKKVGDGLEIVLLTFIFHLILHSLFQSLNSASKSPQHDEKQLQKIFEYIRADSSVNAKMDSLMETYKKWNPK